MARQREKIYRRRRPVRTLLKILGIGLAVLLVLALVIFFWFQRYIYYTSEGVRLDVPFLRGILDPLPEDATAEPQVTDELVLENGEEDHGAAEEDEEDEDEAAPDTAVNAILMDPGDLTDTVDWPAYLRSTGVNSLLLPYKDETGQLAWSSQVELAQRYDVSGETDPPAALEALAEDGEVQVSALLFCFIDDLMGTRNRPMALEDEAGGVYTWSDTGAWLDPANEDSQQYITDLCLELGELGVDEIVLAGFTYPPDAPVELSPAEQDQVVTEFLTDLSAELEAAGMTLSLLVEELSIRPLDGEEPVLSMDFTALSHVVHRFYCIVETETEEDEARMASLLAAAQAVLGEDYMDRFVPGGSSGYTSEGSWLSEYHSTAGNGVTADPDEPDGPEE